MSDATYIPLDTQWPRRRYFHPGEQVTMTKHALGMGLQGRARSALGVVVASHPSGLSVKVLRDGIKQAEWYASQFWRRPR